MGRCGSGIDPTGCVGPTTVSEGFLNVRHSSALGGTGNGTFVDPGAELQLEGGVNVAAEPLTLFGSDSGGRVALENVSGNNIWGSGNGNDVPLTLIDSGLVFSATACAADLTFTAVGEALLALLQGRRASPAAASQVLASDECFDRASARPF